MADIQSATAEIRRGKMKDRRRNHGKNIVFASATQGGHKQHVYAFSHNAAMLHTEALY